MLGWFPTWQGDAALVDAGESPRQRSGDPQVVIDGDDHRGGDNLPTSNTQVGGAAGGLSGVSEQNLEALTGNWKEDDDLHEMDGDAYADKMLSQFPAYGTCNQLQQQHLLSSATNHSVHGNINSNMNNNVYLIQSPSMLGETADPMSTYQAERTVTPQQQQHREGVAVSGVDPSTLAYEMNGGTRHEDWDFDEQNLWKGTDALSSTETFSSSSQENWYQQQSNKKSLVTPDASSPDALPQLPSSEELESSARACAASQSGTPFFALRKRERPRHAWLEYYDGCESDSEYEDDVQESQCQKQQKEEDHHVDTDKDEQQRQDREVEEVSSSSITAASKQQSDGGAIEEQPSSSSAVTFGAKINNKNEIEGTVSAKKSSPTSSRHHMRNTKSSRRHHQQQQVQQQQQQPSKFPTPMFLDADSIENSADDRQQKQREGGGRLSSSAITDPKHSSLPKKSVEALAALEDRQHWMPDQLCKQCYACDVQFTVFRRRHHCRMCGQVFCNACSSYFVPAAPTTAAKVPPSATKNTSNTTMDSNQSNINGPSSAGNSSAGNGGSKGDGGGASISSTVRVCKMCNDQVTEKGGLVAIQQQQQSAHLKNNMSIDSNSSDISNKDHLLRLSTPKTQQKQHHHNRKGQSSSSDTHGTSIAGGYSSTTSASALRSRRLLFSEQMRNVVNSSDAPSPVDVDPSSIQAQSFGSKRKGLPLASTEPSKPLGTAMQQQQQQIAEEPKYIEPSQESFRPENREHVPTTDGVGTLNENASTSLAEDVSTAKEASTQQQQENSPQDLPCSPGMCIINKSAIPREIVSAAPGEEGTVREGNRHLGMVAANHLERMAIELLRLHAPLLWETELQQQLLSQSVFHREGDESAMETAVKVLKSDWINQLLTLATRACATVNPSVKQGDFLDIRPYCKIKVIAGGSYEDCAYISGVLFRKQVSHKRMARVIENPRIMLMSGGIEFTRTENRIASLETLFEQEEKYMEILVGKILKLKPDILMVGRSVSRRAQELLLKANVGLIQRVKMGLLQRISRQTGATIISSTDHVMNQFGADVLGSCYRFRLVTFRDNELWTDNLQRNKPQGEHQRLSIAAMLADPELSNHERQAALAADQLGEDVLDGSEAIKTGLSKRGVTQTFVMLEGCPKDLGCTIVLRGASKAALKQVKLVLRFLINVAYNLRLETSYLKERCARIRPDYSVLQRHTYSSSLCIDYGNPPRVASSSRKIPRPWNGGNGEITPRPVSGEITAFDHQSILVTSVWMTEKTQCCPCEMKGICYYSLQDVALGQFLRDSCFNLASKCPKATCPKSVLDHSLSFVHNDGLINIVVEEMDQELPPSPFHPPRSSDGAKEDGDDGIDDHLLEDELDLPIATWTYCRICKKMVTPTRYISENTWKYSFGKFLESFFYNRDAIFNTVHCSCSLQKGAVLYFGCGKLAARFSYEKVKPLGVFVRRNLPMDMNSQKEEALRRLEVMSVASSDLFVRFHKHIEKVTREARSLFNSAVNRPEHLQTVRSELIRIGTEVDHAAKTFLEKITSVSDNIRRDNILDENSSSVLAVAGNDAAALFRFPLFARRYLFLVCSAWNEKLSVAGEAISAMRKLSSSSYGRSDSNMISYRGGVGGVYSDGGVSDAALGDPLTEELQDAMKRLHKLNEQCVRYNVNDITQLLPITVVTATQQKHQQHAKQDAVMGEFDDDVLMCDDPYDSMDFADGVDADVMASRRRLQTSQQKQQLLSVAKNDREPTPGGTMKSAITRFFNRGGRDADPYQVPLGMFAEGRPRLHPGLQGTVVPVVDEQLSTIIAYSLASAEYARQFRHYYSKMENTATTTTSAAGKNSPIRSHRGRNVAGLPSSLPPKQKLNRSQPNVGDRLPPSNRARRSGAGDLSPSRSDLGRRRGGASNNTRKTNNRKSTPIQSPPSKQYDTASRPPAMSSPPMNHASSSSGGGNVDHQNGNATNTADGRSLIERQMLVRHKSHIKHTFEDVDGKGQVTCKFVCTTYWATQFHAVRQVFLSNNNAGNPSHNKIDGNKEIEQAYVESLSSAFSWAASGGKSGASFARTSDSRFVIKCISRTELQMFLDCAPAYFEYLSKAFFHGLPTVICKIVGVYQIGIHNRENGKRSMEQVAVMQNIFYNRKISKIFDLKGSLRGRFAALQLQQKLQASASETVDLDNQKRVPSENFGNGNDSSDNSILDVSSHSHQKRDNTSHTASVSNETSSQQQNVEPSPSTLLDGDFLEFTLGRPMPMTDRAKHIFGMSILNDTLFLSLINVLDYSILVGVDEQTNELVVGIIDFMRQYDILKQMERVGKSLPMVVGVEAPTIIQPPLYKQRFIRAMEQYFMTVPSKWTNISLIS